MANLALPGVRPTKAQKGRATLAETWSLSGKEAMSLALSQGRFDRQMQRHTDALREELQESIIASEKRLNEMMAKVHDSISLMVSRPQMRADGGHDGGSSSASAEVKCSALP